MPFLAMRIIAGPDWSQTRNSLGTNVGRALVEDGDDVVLLDLLRDAGPELTLHVPRSLTSLGSLIIHQCIKFFRPVFNWRIQKTIGYQSY